MNHLLHPRLDTPCEGLAKRAATNNVVGMKNNTCSVHYLTHPLKRSLGVLCVALAASALLLAMSSRAQAQGSGTIYCSDFLSGELQSFPLPNGSGGMTYMGIPNAAGVAFDASGNLFIVSLTANGTITTSDIWKLPAGSTTPFKWYTANLGKPHGIAFDLSQNMLIATATNTGTVTGIQKLIISNGNPVMVQPFGTSSSYLVKPFAVAVDTDGSVFVTDGGGDGNGHPGNGAVLKFNSNGNMHTIFAQMFAGFYVPYGIAIDGSHYVYITNQTDPTLDHGNMYSFTPQGNLSVTFDPTNLRNPLGLVFDGAGNLYVANQTGGDIRIFSPTTGTDLGRLTRTDPKPHFLAFKP